MLAWRFLSALALISLASAAPGAHLLRRRHADSAPALPRAPERPYDTSLPLPSSESEASHVVHPEDEAYRSYFLPSSAGSPAELELEQPQASPQGDGLERDLEVAEMIKEMIKGHLQQVREPFPAPASASRSERAKPDAPDLAARSKMGANLTRSRARMGRRACVAA